MLTYRCDDERRHDDDKGDADDYDDDDGKDDDCDDDKDEGGDNNYPRSTPCASSSYPMEMVRSIKIMMIRMMAAVTQRLK